MAVSVAQEEAARLRAVDSCGLLDTPPEQEFEDLVKLAVIIFNTPLGALSFVDRDRLWFKAAVGLGVPEMPRQGSFCTQAILQPDPLVVPDALLDSRFRHSPLVDTPQGLRFYAGAPLLDHAGHRLGTLCVADYVPRQPSEEQVEALVLLARQAATRVEWRRAHRSRLAEAALRSSATRVDLPAAGSDDGADAREHTLRQFFALSLDLLCIASFDGYFLELSRGWARTLGYTLEELKAKPFLEFVHPEDREATLAENEHLVSGGNTFTFENRYRCRDGGWRWLHWSATASPENRLFYAVARDVTERKSRQNELEHRAQHDPLTGLLNRVAFEERLDRVLERARREPDGRIAVLYLDLDGFKEINDRFGHFAGDEVLAAAAQRLEHALRPGDLVGRYGGDEFVVALGELGSAKDAIRAVADRIRRAFRTPFVASGHSVRCRASIGIATSGRDDLPSGALLRKADAAMYRSKSAARRRH